MKFSKSGLCKIGFLVSALFLSIGLTGCGDPTIKIYEGEYDSYTMNQFLEKYPNYLIKIDKEEYPRWISKTQRMHLYNRFDGINIITLTLLDISKDPTALGIARMEYKDRFYSLVDTNIVIKVTSNQYDPLLFYVLNKDRSKDELPTSKDMVGDTENYTELTINQFLEKYPHYYVIIDQTQYHGSMSDYDKQVIYNNSVAKSIVVGLLTRDDPEQVKDYAQLDNYDLRYEIGNTGIFVKCVRSADEPFYFYVPKNLSENSKEDRTIQ